MDVKKLNTTSLAYMGEAVYEVYVRSHVMEKDAAHTDALHRRAVAFVRDVYKRQGIATVNKNLDKLVAKEKITAEAKEEIMGRIHGSTDISIVADADLIIEAATEEMESKKALFAELDKLCKPEAIIATNTSSLSITEIASATERPDKVIGMHFFNPVPAMKLVEIICGLATSEETEKTVTELATVLGKTPVKVEEAPGFVVNRILIPMINEAVGILADGVATEEGIDQALQLGANLSLIHILQTEMTRAFTRQWQQTA